MEYLKIIGVFLILAGVIINFSSKYIVKKYKLDKIAKCDFESEMSSDEIEAYKFNKAFLSLKVLAMLVILPGIFFIVYSFR